MSPDVLWGSVAVMTPLLSVAMLTLMLSDIGKCSIGARKKRAR